MNDLISREDTIREIVKRLATDFLDVEAIATVIHIVNQMPSIEEQPTIEERKKGKWIEIMYTEDRTGMKCSECGYRYGGIFGSNYCPHCGADMGNMDSTS